MSNKTALGIILAIVIVIAGLIYLLSSSGNSPFRDGAGDNYSTTDKVENENSANGRVIFSVTDAAADMGAISEITLKVNGVSVHSATEGWVTASTVSRTYDLLSLNARGESELLADTELKAGTYDQIRLAVDSVSVRTKAGDTKEARLPSGTLTINAKLAVNAAQTSSVNFDFLADKSLHTTGEGVYIFAPVVKTETRSGSQASIDGKSVVTINGGSIDNSNTAGMDVDGSMRLDFQLKSDQKLEIGADNKINIPL